MRMIIPVPNGEARMFWKLTAALLVFGGTAIAQEKKSTIEELAAAGGITPCVVPTGDTVGQRECEKRDTARLFFMAGQPNAALRILCNTRAAIEVFRPNGPVGSDKLEDNAAGNKRCLQDVGVEPKSK